MEFLVIAQVPDGDGARASARELGAAGRLRRLWRAPSGTVGLFAADDPVQLTEALTAAPALVGTGYQVLALAEHPDDPLRSGRTGRPGVGPEYLITTTVFVPADTAAAAIEDAEARQARRHLELARRGNLVRLWALPVEPDGPRSVGLWRARDPGDLMAVLESLPLAEWMTIDTTPLHPHPGDPVRFA